MMLLIESTASVKAYIRHQSIFFAKYQSNITVMKAGFRSAIFFVFKGGKKTSPKCNLTTNETIR
jgi:hypothetical protein